MNKGLFRLVFSAHLGMFVPASECVLTSTGSGSGSVARRRRRALAVAALLALTLDHAYALDPNALPTGGAISSGVGSIATTGNAMTVNQNTNKMIVNWSNFNIGSSATVNFVQPSSTASALNRIGGSDPSQINGRLTATGHVYLINTNGIIFGEGAQINVGSLTASSLDVADDLFNAGILSNTQNESVFSGTTGYVMVEQGATITAATGGRVMLLGKNVTNNGVISTPEGQTILAAGEKVYLADSTDPVGLLVEVDAGGAAKNLGEIIAKHGNVTLVGLAVNQEGTITASTSVRANGSIMLLARDTVTTGTMQATNGGTVTLGKNSATTVEVEVDDKEEVLDKQDFAKSEVLLSGKIIDMEGSIVAHGGNVTATDVLNNSSTPPATGTGALIYLGEQAAIDVSGLDASAPMSRNQLEIQLYSEQLKDAPLLRGGALFGQTIYVDARKGTPITDIAPYTELKGRTVAEKMSAGGTVTLTANAGDVVLREGSLVDVSAGSITYEAGIIKESSLRYNGKLIPIAEATTDKIYQGTGETYSVTDPKWGVTRTWSLGSSPQGTFQQSYRAGSNAGALNIAANKAVLDGVLNAQTSPGELQREAPPAGGTLTINTRNSIRVVQEVNKLPKDFTFDFDTTPVDTTLPDQQSKETQMDVDYLDAGFTHVELNARNTLAGNSATASNVVVDAGMKSAAMGSIKLTATGAIAINQDITSPGGSIAIDAPNTVLADGVTISTAGLWTNDLPNGVGVPTAPIAKNGGNLSVTGGFAMGQGSLLDASAGAWLTSSGKFTGGNGGDITLNVSKATQPTLPDVQGKIQSYGYTQGGVLSLTTAQNIQIGGSQPATGKEFWLPESFFEQGGFSKYNLKTEGGNSSSFVMGDSSGAVSVIHPQMQTLVALKDYTAQVSGSALGKVAAPVLLAQYLRAPASVSFSADGDLTVLPNTTIQTDVPISRTGTKGEIVLASTRGQLSIFGDLIAPGGSITATISGEIKDYTYDNTRSIFVGENAHLIATGQYLQPPVIAGSLGKEEILNGGTITLNGGDLGVVVLKEGSVLDVSGASGEVNVQGSTGVTREMAYGAAGSITLSSRNALVLDGDLLGNTTGTGAGSTLTLNITGNASNPADGVPHPSAARALTVTQHKTLQSDGLTAGDALDSVIGLGAIAVDQISDGGFDRLNLSVQGIANDKIVLSTVGSDLNLKLPTALVLDAGLLDVTGSGAVIVGAAHTTLLNSGTTAPAAPIKGTATLEVDADFIDLVGTQAVTGVRSTTLSAQKDIRGRDDGSLQVPGDLVLRARQIYPATNKAYSFEAIGTGSKITVQSNGETATPVLSAGGQLTLTADEIVQGGVLRAPLGKITLDAATKLTLAAGSLTSVSAEGQLIPYGLTGLGGLTWAKPGGQLAVANDAVSETLPEKKITLKSADVDLQPGAKVDISGGGDVLAYEWIEGIGGSKDILGQAGVYAVMPTLRDEYAPYDPSYQKIVNPEFAINANAQPLNTDLKPGDAVYLSGIPGLAAGSYTLLPGRYALLPGAFMLQTSTNGKLVRGQSVGQADGSTLVSGYRTTLADTTTNADTPWDTFRITDGSIFRPAAGTISKAPAEYRLSTGDQFFQKLALDTGSVVPRLASDAGQLVLDAQNSLTLGAQFLTDKTDGARGALVDITSNNISVVSTIGADNGTLQLTADALNALNVESLLLGGTREQVKGVDGITIATNATNVTFANDAHHALQVTELVAVAKDTLTVNSGATIQTLATTQPAGTTRLRASGDGALLAVSALNEVVLDRTGTSATPALGTLDIKTGSTIQAHRSLALDSTQAANLAGDITVNDGGSATLGANRILLGSPDDTVVGARINDALLTSLGALSKVTLNSSKNIDVYGPVSLGNSDLDMVINAAGVAGHMGENDSASLTANNFVLKNSAGATDVAATSTAGSKIDINAQNILFEGRSATDTNTNVGKTTISGFAYANLNATGEIAFSGAGETKLQADTSTLTSTRITAAKLDGAALAIASGADYALKASGNMITAKLAAAATSDPVDLSAIKSLGSKLKLEAADIALGGDVELAAGQIDVVATTGDLNVTNNARLSVASAAVEFDKYTKYTPAGTVSLQADTGNVTINAGAKIEVSAGGDAPAGTVKITAQNGTTSVAAGTLQGQAAASQQGGSFILDTKYISDSANSGFSDLNATLNDGGFDDAREMRIRGGDVAIAAGAIATTQKFVLSADAGKIDIAGTVNADGVNGGSIEIYARDNVTLMSSGQLLARGVGDTKVKGDGQGSGGSVLLSSLSGTISAEVFEADGTTRLANAAKIDVSGNQVSELKGDSGEVTFRAGRTGADNTAFNPVTTTGTATAYAVSGVTLSRGLVVAFKPNIKNSGTTPTLNGKTIKKNGGDALAVGDLALNQTYLAVYDGTNFQLVSAGSSGLMANGSGAAGTGISIAADVPAAVTGAGTVRLEAVRVYEKTTLDGKAQLQLAADTQAFYSKADTVLAGYKLTQDGLVATLTPGVEVRSSNGGLTVSSDWNLDTATNGTLSMAGAGTLALRAFGNLALNGTLSDGFSTATLTTAGTAQGLDAWSYNLVGGADFTAANYLATNKSTTTGNISLANAKGIRTGAGAIRMAAGGNLTLGNDSSVIYTAGQKSADPSGYASTSTTHANAFYGTGGGDVEILIQGNITGALGTSNTQQLVNNWLFREGGGTDNRDLSWWVMPDKFKAGVATFGGGDVTIKADGNITNFSAAAATTARYDNYDVVKTTDPDTGVVTTVVSAGTGNYSIEGGGNLLIKAGGDIANGVYYAGRGNIALNAGGGVRKLPSADGSSNPFGTVLALQDASAKVYALKDAFIETVFNPTLFAQSSSNASSLGVATLNGSSPFFLTYGTDSAFQMASLMGDVTLGPSDTKNITSRLSGFISVATPALEIHPATVEAVAYSGNIQIGRLVLAPAAKGNVSLLAVGDVSEASNGLIAVSDYDVQLIPTTASPYAGAGAGTAYATLLTGIRTGHAGTPVHLGDEQPLVIIARDGSVTLEGNTKKDDTAGPGLLSPKAAFIHAGKNITLDADIQHVDSNDITVIEAGNDFVMPRDTNSIVQLSGPGELLVQAGRNVNLGSSKGIVTVANTKNSALPDQGAAITVLAGLGKEGANLAEYIAAYINPTGNGPAVLQGDSEKFAKYRKNTADAVTAYMRKLSGDNSLADTDAMTQYLALDEDRQAVFAYRHFSSELLASGKSYKDSKNHNRGDNAIATLFPTAQKYDGDVSLFNSQLRTLRDGSIDVLTPGGFINVGVPTSSGNDIGIVTEGGGDIRAFAETGFQVEQSRVITQFGSDITVWVNNGDIDAGRGSKTAVSVPKREISTDADGNTTVEVKGTSTGSGIRAQTYDPDGPTGNKQAPALGSVALMAPRGILNASEAGIAAGNFLAVAVQVLGGSNIQVSGSSTGVPIADAGGLAGSLAGVSSTASDAGRAATDDMAKQLTQTASTDNFIPSFVSVEVIGLGD